ncbi:MAG: LCP family protein [Chloroflexota bacterium]
MRTPPRRSSRTHATTLRLIIILFVLVLGGGGLAAYLLYFQPVLSAVNQATGQVVPRPTFVATPGAPPVPTPTLPSLSGTRPINVLLLGSDTDAKFDGVYDTQIMIVVSIDPVRKQVTMLSIPRDLWVVIPGWGVGKIGTAYHIGGLALARDTVEKDFGIPIHYYAWVGLNGFIKVVDTFGGVDVDVSHPIIDNAYPDDVNSADPYAYRHLYIPAGPQHLNGAQALEYVRSRHGDLIGDFGRSQRQQQVLDALRRKSSGREIVTRLPQLASDLKDSVRTDMSLPDLAKFAAFADQIKGHAIGQHTLAPPTYSSDGTSTDGQSIVIPNWRAIRPLVDSLFGLHTAATLPMTVAGGIGPPPGATPVPKASATLARPLSTAVSAIRPRATSLAGRVLPRSAPSVAPRQAQPAATVVVRRQITPLPVRTAVAVRRQG